MGAGQNQCNMGATERQKSDSHSRSQCGPSCIRSCVQTCEVKRSSKVIKSCAGVDGQLRNSSQETLICLRQWREYEPAFVFRGYTEETRRNSNASTGEKQESVSETGFNSNPEDQEKSSEDLEKEDAHKIAAAALAFAKTATEASTDGKIEINEVRDFVGEEVQITKFVDPNSKAAVAARKRTEMQAASSTGLDDWEEAEVEHIR